MLTKGYFCLVSSDDYEWLNKMLVCEYFGTEKIDLAFVQDLADKKESSYWESCIEFVSDNWTNDLENLSEKQNAWLTRILDDCTEERIKGKNVK